jgi:hypothetical protein
MAKEAKEKGKGKVFPIVVSILLIFAGAFSAEASMTGAIVGNYVFSGSLLGILLLVVGMVSLYFSFRRI